MSYQAMNHSGLTGSQEVRGFESLRLHVVTRANGAGRRWPTKSIPHKSHQSGYTFPVRGSIRERSKGVWELRAYVGRDGLSGKPRQISRTFRGGKRDANTALAKLVAETSDGKHGGSNATVAQLLDAWLESAEDRLSPVTIAGYKHSVETYLRKQIGGLRLSRLGVHDLDKLYRSLTAVGCSPYVIRQAHAAIRAALTQAQRWGWVGSNAASLARPPVVPASPVSAPTPGQVRNLIDTSEDSDPQLAAMLLITALTGCRRGELCGLRWSDIDLEAGTMHVQRAWVIAAGKAHLKTPKSGKDRTIALDPLAILTLKLLLKAQELTADRINAALPEDGWLLSKDGMGFDPRNPQMVGRQVAVIAAAAGESIHLHQLRHYAATELLAAGVNVRTIAGRLGHSDPAVTLRVYSHQIEERDREAADILGRALAPAENRRPPKEIASAT